MMRVLLLITLFGSLAMAQIGRFPFHIPPAGLPATSYENTGGTGDRSAVITAAASDPSPDLFDGGSIANLIDGVNTNVAYFQGFTAVNCFMSFDFGTSQLITEFRWRQNAAQTGAGSDTWQWQGSANGSDWTNIGTTFQLGHESENPHVITTMSGATTGYRHYRILGISGTQNSGPYLQEIEFKLVAYP